MPRYSRRQDPNAPVVIHDLSNLLEFKIQKVVNTGVSGGHWPSTYLVKVRRSPALRRRDGEPAMTDCMLKVYPSTAHGAGLYDNDFAANTNLVKATAPSTPEDACTTLFTLDNSTDAPKWPRCLGSISAPSSDDVANEGRWFACEPTTKGYRALLFEHICHLTPLTKAMVEEDVAADLLDSVVELHANNIVHGSLHDPGAFPDIRFRSVYARKHPNLDVRDVIIMDFEHSRVWNGKPEENRAFDEETKKVAEMLQITMSGQDPVDFLPNEVKKLLLR